MLKGLLAGGITLGVAAVFPAHFVHPFLVGVLGLSAGVYPGFAMAAPEHGRPTLQWLAAVSLVALALAGLVLSPLVFIAAWVLHALWSLAHHLTALGDGAPEGYPAVSFSFDLVMAGFLIFMWTAGL